MLANALNNMGVAAVVTGVIAPGAAYLLGTFAIDDPLRFLSLVVIWSFAGIVLLGIVQRILRGLE